jgi:tetratricopeptide (TPR) repeat protein
MELDHIGERAANCAMRMFRMNRRVGERHGRLLPSAGVAWILAASAALPAGNVVAQSLWGFQPTPLEWASWPEYCRIQWTQWSGGRDPQGNRIYSDAARSGLRAAMGDQTYDSMHHWCAGIHYLVRAKAQTDLRTRETWLGRATDEAEYTYQRASTSSPVFPNISVTLAQLKIERKKFDEAIAILERSISAQPERLEPYIVLTNALKMTGRLDDATAVLERAQKNLKGDSPEIQYNLGLLSLELGDIPGAVKSAQIAYAKGYPLPGLKRKLIKLGKWQEPPAPGASPPDQVSGGQ